MTEIKRIGLDACDDDDDGRGKRGKRGHLGPPGPTGPTGGGGGGTDSFTESPPFVWQASITDAGTSNGTLAPTNYPTNTFVAMRAGTLAGLQTAQDAAMIAGSLTFAITINGVATSITVVDTSSSNSHGGTTTGSVPYLAGDLIGVQYVADASANWDIETLGVFAWIEIIQPVP